MYVTLGRYLVIVNQTRVEVTSVEIVIGGKVEVEVIVTEVVAVEVRVMGCR